MRKSARTAPKAASNTTSKQAPDAAEASAQATTSTDRRGDFALMSYEALRQELLYHLEQLARIEQLAMIVTGAMFSWMAVNSATMDRFGVAMILWCAPLFFTLFCLYRHQIEQSTIRGIADFIASRLAPEFDAVDLSWEEQMRRMREESGGAHRFRASNRVFWSMLIGANLLAPIVFASLWLGSGG